LIVRGCVIVSSVDAERRNHDRCTYSWQSTAIWLGSHRCPFRLNVGRIATPPLLGAILSDRRISGPRMLLHVRGIPGWHANRTVVSRRASHHQRNLEGLPPSPFR